VVLRDDSVPARFSDIAPRLAIGAGLVVSSIILVALGMHLE
jgi:hypothetical protein